MRRLTRIVAVCCASAALLTGAAAGAPPNPDAIFLAPHGSDGNPCTHKLPCASFDRAYDAAQPGQTVVVGGGRYPPQLIEVDPAKLDAPADVVFEPAGQVTIDGDLVVYGSHIVFRGSRHKTFRLRYLRIEGSPGEETTAHAVTAENLDGAGFAIGPTHDITLKGGDWGPNYVCAGAEGEVENVIGPDAQFEDQWPHEILLDGIYLHDQNSYDLDACHMGGLFIISGHDIKIANSIFSQNVVYQIQIQDFTSPDCCGQTYGAVHDLVIENNWFGPPVTGLADPGRDKANDFQPEIQFDPRNGECWENVLVRFNSFHNGGVAPVFDGEACFENFRVIGNIGETPGWQCAIAPGITWAYNAWVGGPCGETDVGISSLPYASTLIGHEDYHLTGGLAQDLVPALGPDYEIATDIDGEARPKGLARDAGADER